MSQRLVKTIKATQVRSIGRPVVEAHLTSAEIDMLTAVARRHESVIQLRQAGLTTQEISRLEFVRWTRERRARD